MWLVPPHRDGRWGHADILNDLIFSVIFNFPEEFLTFLDVQTHFSTKNRELNTLEMSILKENWVFIYKTEICLCAFFWKKAQNKNLILVPKNLFFSKMLIFIVFSSRFYVEKHVLSAKKVKKSSRKLKITEKIRPFLPPECPRDLTSHPYGGGAQ